ncbi:MAG: translation initiation factor [Bacteroidales bacterium]
MDWKDKLGAAFNIDPEDVVKSATEESENAQDESQEIAHAKQNLKIMLDKRNRNGKSVTLVVDYIGSEVSLKELAKSLKRECGVGGSARAGEILIQGDFRDKIHKILIAKGYRAKII